MEILGGELRALVVRESRPEGHMLHTRFRIEKFNSGEPVPYEVSEFEENILVNLGIQNLWKLGTGLGGTAWANANANLGVGNSSVAESAGNTALQGASQAYELMLATFPSLTNQTIAFKSSFGPAEANFAWNEFDVVTASGTVGIPLNRKVSAQGTKTSGQNWTLEVDVALA